MAKFGAFYGAVPRRYRCATTVSIGSIADAPTTNGRKVQADLAVLNYFLTSVYTDRHTTGATAIGRGRFLRPAAALGSQREASLVTV